MPWLYTGAAIYTENSTASGSYVRLNEMCSGIEESLDQCKVVVQEFSCTSVVGIVCQQGETASVTT